MRIVHYINQFFAGVGGEDRADTAPAIHEGPIGPGRLLQAALGDRGRVVGTVICGDGRFADQADETAGTVVDLIQSLRPDVVVAGPAFEAGRYGLACGRVCAEVSRRLRCPGVTGMHPGNVAVELYRQDVLIVPTTATATGMKDAMTRLARLALKLGAGDSLGPPTDDGYLPRGHRDNVCASIPGSARALEMLLARLEGRPFTTEVPLPAYERVAPPPPVADLRQARLAVITEGGLVPRGNPDRLEVVWATKWLKYTIAGLDALARGHWDVAHGGYDAAFTLEDPNRMVPLDALREMQRRGEIGSLLDAYYVTCGAHVILARIANFGREIAAELRANRVDAALLVAT